MEMKKAQLDFVKNNNTRRFGVGEQVFIVSTTWINSWKRFLQCDSAPHPGPIRNDVLLDTHQRPRRNLFRGKHYRGVNRRIWSYWIDKYGGGPEIVRGSVDIYE
jgi:hypothetical protein